MSQKRSVSVQRRHFDKPDTARNNSGGINTSATLPALRALRLHRYGTIPHMEKYGSFSLYQLSPYYSYLLNHWIKEASPLTVGFQELLQDNECLSFLSMASDKTGLMTVPCLYAYSSNDKNRDQSLPSLESENSVANRLFSPAENRCLPPGRLSWNKYSYSDPNPLDI